MHRAHTFSVLTNDWWSYLDEIYGLLEKPAPLLERLVIRTSYNAIYNLPNTLPFELFAGYAPRLRIMEARGTTLPLSSPVLAGLTSLSLCNLRGKTCPSLDNLVAAIASMPNLQTLALRNAHDDQLLPYAQPPIYIPRLRFLQVNTDSINCAAFLQRISYPRSVVQRFTISCRRVSIFDNLSHAGNINDTFHALGIVLGTRINPIRYLWLGTRRKFYSGLSTSLEAWGQAGQETHVLLRPPQHPPDLQIISTQGNMEMLLKALEPLPMWNMEFLHVASDVKINLDMWRVFREIETLRTVYICGDNIYLFLVGLQYGCRMRSTSAFSWNRNKLYFKGLRILVSEGCISAWDHMAHVVCFSERRKQGVGLHDLYILGGDWWPPALELLRPFVTSLYQGSGLLIGEGTALLEEVNPDSWRSLMEEPESGIESIISSHSDRS
ncbi:hypothetical protein H0H81_012611 [Sphagnurus paluster]|uniref:Uncharacterized protein n=1 Tax=Sphagnurus paluster TaxID=117069 RepID=A0A9P7FUF8_9AGAR|nr:hypothetical protein H0H81_012611 [Sphagnurus paluster]